MDAVLSYIGSHWMEWVCTIIVTLVGLGYKSLSKRLKEEKKQNEAIAEGVKNLLRESIVSNYNKYLEKGHCPIYAKESMKAVYKSYHDLGGNDVATSLYEKILKMPEETTNQRPDAFIDDGK